MMSDPYNDPSSTYITVVNSKLNMKQVFERLNHDIVSCNVSFNPTQALSLCMMWSLYVPI